MECRRDWVGPTLNLDLPYVSFAKLTPSQGPMVGMMYKPQTWERVSKGMPSVCLVNEERGGLCGVR